MDGSTESITPHDLYARLGTAAAPLPFDAWRRKASQPDKPVQQASQTRASMV